MNPSKDSGASLRTIEAERAREGGGSTQSRAAYSAAAEHQHNTAQ